MLCHTIGQPNVSISAVSHNGTINYIKNTALQSGCLKPFVMGGCSDVAINIPIVCLSDIIKVLRRMRMRFGGRLLDILDII